MSGHRRIGRIRNHAGALYVRTHPDHPQRRQWGLLSHDGVLWQDIPETLWTELNAYGVGGVDRPLAVEAEYLTGTAL